MSKLFVMSELLQRNFLRSCTEPPPPQIKTKNTAILNKLGIKKFYLLGCIAEHSDNESYRIRVHFSVMWHTLLDKLHPACDSPCTVQTSEHRSTSGRTSYKPLSTARRLGLWEPKRGCVINTLKPSGHCTYHMILSANHRICPQSLSVF